MSDNQIKIESSEAPFAEFNKEKHTENIKKVIKEVRATKKLAEISLDDLITPDAEELQLKKNFPCLRCTKLPIGPVQ